MKTHPRSKEGNENFDVPKGCFDGAEVCELVSTYILNQLKDLKIVNLRVVTFNLHQNTYEPYRKPDNYPVCINVNSNHPPTTRLKLSKSIGKRLSELSGIKEVFEKAI